MLHSLINDFSSIQNRTGVGNRLRTEQLLYFDAKISLSLGNTGKKGYIISFKIIVQTGVGRSRNEKSWMSECQKEGAGMRSRQITWLVLAILLGLTPVSLASWWATQSGNFSDSATWGGATLDPASDAVVVADNYTVTVDSLAGGLEVRAVYAGYLTSAWASSTGWMVMNDPTASLTTRFLYVASADDSNGAFTQNDGTVHVAYAGEGGVLCLKQNAGLYNNATRLCRLCFKWRHPHGRCRHLCRLSGESLLYSERWNLHHPKIFTSALITWPR